MQTEHQMATNPQTKPTDLDFESAGGWASTIHIRHCHLLFLFILKADIHCLLEIGRLS